MFVTSGALEALEVAWSIARLHFDAVGEPQRRKAIVRDLSYHGVALSALSFNGINPMAAPFGPAQIGVRQVSSTNAFRSAYGSGDPAFTAVLVDELEQLIRDEGPETIAIIVAEPVQMGGGCLVPPAGVLVRAARSSPTATGSCWSPTIRRPARAAWASGTGSSASTSCRTWRRAGPG